MDPQGLFNFLKGRVNREMLSYLPALAYHELKATMLMKTHDF